MAELEKVIKGLECCTGLGCHHGCKYLKNGCTQFLKMDALELLKEQTKIVRCKDCNNFIPCGENTGMCNLGIGTGRRHIHSKNWYCANGVAKGGEQE